MVFFLAQPLKGAVRSFGGGEKKEERDFRSNDGTVWLWEGHASFQKVRVSIPFETRKVPKKIRVSPSFQRENFPSSKTCHLGQQARL